MRQHASMQERRNEEGSGAFAFRHFCIGVFAEVG